MSEVEQEQRSVAASPAEARLSLWRGWFSSTGAPPAWALVRYMVCGLVLAAALAGALPQVRGPLLAALAGVIVAAAGSGGPSGVAHRLAVIAAGGGLLLTVVAFATGGGFVGSLAYMLVATEAETTAPVTT
jgi:hypothetical protein